MDYQTHATIEIKTKRSFVAKDTMIEKRGYTLSDLQPVEWISEKMSKSLHIKSDFCIDMITAKDAEEVLTFLKKFFFQDEPLNLALDLGECKELEEYSLKCIPDKCSFKAVNSENKIIGVVLNGFIKKPSPDEVPKKLADGCNHQKFRKIMTLMDIIDSKFNIYDLYPNVDTILDVKIISVDDNCRGLGIAGRLIEQTLDYTHEHSISVLHVLCTSHFSARVLEKLDFHEVFKLPYSDYVDENGEQVLKPAPPHVAARILVKDV